MPNVTELSHRLLAWFYRNKRALPWREEHDPYRVWISEVMLQQTRSDTAARYYGRWLTRFPTVQSLALADQEEVLKLWEGLGYYSRARNLHRSARIIVEHWKGRFPDTEEKLRQLPGIGEYTAAAVLSIAFAKPAGVVDGNVLRVVSRLLAANGMDQPGGNRAAQACTSADLPDTTSPDAARRRLKITARSFVEASFLRFHPGWINQAWMELGALVCLSRPRCDHCPVSYTCRAYREDRITEFPPRAPSRPLPVRRESLLLLLTRPPPQQIRQELERRGFDKSPTELANIGKLLRRRNLPVLLVKRSEKGLLGGLWELPNFPERGKKLADILSRLSVDILLDTNQEVCHRYSHFEIRFNLIVATLRGQQPLEEWCEQHWVRPAELKHYPRPKVHIEAMRRFGLIEE
jgi:A/G-specific adenine glycosylase